MSAADDYPTIPNGVKRPGGWGLLHVRMCGEIDRRRAECAAWMNGVADVVEPLGYDREAACGPADLLPGLETLAEMAYGRPS